MEMAAGVRQPRRWRRAMHRITTPSITFLSIYYTALFCLNRITYSIGFNLATLTLVPIGLGLVGFALVCLGKIFLDIWLSNQSTQHLESYHQLVSEISMAKEDLRSKGILID